MLLADVSLPLHTQSTNTKLRVHRMALRRKAEAERTAVGLVLRTTLKRALAPGEHGVVTLVRTRVPRSKGLDDDNLRGALKAVRDEVALCIGVDDKDKRVRWDYDEAPGPEHGVRIVVEAVDAVKPLAQLLSLVALVTITGCGSIDPKCVVTCMAPQPPCEVRDGGP